MRGYCGDVLPLFFQSWNASNTCLKWGYEAHVFSLPPFLLRPMIDLAPSRKTLGVLVYHAVDAVVAWLISHIEGISLV